MMIAQVVNAVPGDFIWTGGDCHLYSNHTEQVEELLSREPFEPPKMTLNPEVKDLFGFTYDDFELSEYVCHPTIAAPVAV